MTTLEDRLRATAQAVTEVIAEGSAPPLRLAEPRSRYSGAGQHARRRWTDRMAPLAAAAAVVLVAVVSVGATHGWFGSDQAAGRGPDGTPPYYISLAAYASPHSPAAADAAVRSTATGSVLARIAPPRPYSAFTVVTGAADDRTFVLGAEQATSPSIRSAAGSGMTGPSVNRDLAAGHLLLVPEVQPLTRVATVTPVSSTQFFMLRLGPDASSPQLSRLKLPPTGQPVAAAALSPDGQKLAVALTPPGHLVVQVTNLVTAATRTWQGQTWTQSWPAGRGDLASQPSPVTLSWAADNRTLALDWPGPVTLRAGLSEPFLLAVSLLDTTAAGSDLTADSSAVVPPGYLIYSGGNAMVTPDGATIVSTGLVPVPAGKLPGNLIEVESSAVGYSARTGAITRQSQIPDWLPVKPAHAPRVLWANTTGSVLIISTSVIKNPPVPLPKDIVVGVLTNGQFTALPGLGAPIASVTANPAGIAW